MFKPSYNPVLFDSYRQNKFIRYNLFFSLLVNLIIWIILTWQIRNFAESIALHYNIYFGIDLLGNWYEIFFIPTFGLAFLAINFLVGAVVYSQEKILSYFLTFGSSFIQFITLLAVMFIILATQ